MAVTLHAQLKSHRTDPSLVPKTFWPSGLDDLDGRPREPTIEELGAELLHGCSTEESLAKADAAYKREFYA